MNDSGGSIAIEPDGSNAQDAFELASERTDIVARTPSYLPTSADQLAAVHFRVDPRGPEGLQFIDSTYQGSNVEFDGLEVRSILELSLVNVRLQEANGELLPIDAADFDLYAEVVSTWPDGEPNKVSYTALGDGETIIMVFSLDIPTPEEVVQMLGSLEVVATPG